MAKKTNTSIPTTLIEYYVAHLKNKIECLRNTAQEYYLELENEEEGYAYECKADVVQEIVDEISDALNRKKQNSPK